MRTTINIHESLMEKAKQKAAESGRTLTSVIEDALRLALEEKPASAVRRRISLPTWANEGFLPGVDLDDTSALLDRMDDIP